MRAFATEVLEVKRLKGSRETVKWPSYFVQYVDYTTLNESPDVAHFEQNYYYCDLSAIISLTVSLFYLL